LVRVLQFSAGDSFLAKVSESHYPCEFLESEVRMQRQPAFLKNVELEKPFVVFD